MPKRIVRRIAFYLPLILFAALGSRAWADSITIGSIQFLGTSAGGSDFKVTLNTSALSSAPLVVSNASLSFGGVTQPTGALSMPTTLLFIIPGGSGIPGGAVTFQLCFDKGNTPVTFTLPSGEKFTVSGINWTKMFPLAGQNTLLPGQSMHIMLTSVPEPGTLGLMGTGLISLGLLFRRRLKLRAS